MCVYICMYICIYIGLHPLPKAHQPICTAAAPIRIEGAMVSLYPAELNPVTSCILCLYVYVYTYISIYMHIYKYIFSSTLCPEHTSRSELLQRLQEEGMVSRSSDIPKRGGAALETAVLLL